MCIRDSNITVNMTFILKFFHKLFFFNYPWIGYILYVQNYHISGCYRKQTEPNVNECEQKPFWQPWMPYLLPPFPEIKNKPQPPIYDSLHHNSIRLYRFVSYYCIVYHIIIVLSYLYCIYYTICYLSLFTQPQNVYTTCLLYTSRCV